MTLLHMQVDHGTRVRPHVKLPCGHEVTFDMFVPDGRTGPIIFTGVTCPYQCTEASWTFETEWRVE